MTREATCDLVLQIGCPVSVVKGRSSSPWCIGKQISFTVFAIFEVYPSIDLLLRKLLRDEPAPSELVFVPFEYVLNVLQPRGCHEICLREHPYAAVFGAVLSDVLHLQRHLHILIGTASQQKQALIILDVTGHCRRDHFDQSTLFVLLFCCVTIPGLGHVVYVDASRKIIEHEFRKIWSLKVKADDVL